MTPPTDENSAGVLYTSKLPLSHVISNNYLCGSRLVKLRTELLLRHVSEHWCTQRGLKGFNLHWMFLIVFAQKILYKLCSCVQYILNFVQETVKNCTRTLISHFASEFSSFCFDPDPWLGPLLENSWSITCELPPYCKNLGSPMLWQCFKCLILAVVPPCTLLGS